LDDDRTALDFGLRDMFCGVDDAGREFSGRDGKIALSIPEWTLEAQQ
jgi:hypothetical protein